MIEVTVRHDDKVIVRGRICDKFMKTTVQIINAWINDPENKKELEEEKPLGSSR